MPRTQLVVTVIPNGGGNVGGKLTIPAQPDLDGCLIVGFEMFTDAQMIATPDRVPVLPSGEALNVTLTLNESADQRFRRMPMTTLIAELQAGIFRQCEPFQVDWNKSIFEFGAACTANTALVIQVQYLRPEDAPELFKGLAQ